MAFILVVSLRMLDNASTHTAETSEFAESTIGEATRDGTYPGNADTLTRFQSMPSLSVAGNAESHQAYRHPAKEGFKHVRFLLSVNQRRN